MTTKFSEDIIPLSDLKINPGKVVSHVSETRRPVLLTSRGRGVAIVQSLRDFEEEAEQLAFTQAVVKGLMDIEDGREMSLAEVKKRFGLK
ncbi:MAG: type II toxin-antitoxin system Phd/YefM family antitoxin [Nitrospirae bacterium]|nr:MAG: type II toxin-antitoxin system Phd/YefM family antitoxin [Nitrospirota bacterium]